MPKLSLHRTRCKLGFGMEVCLALWTILPGIDDPCGFVAGQPFVAPGCCATTSAGPTVHARWTNMAGTLNFWQYPHTLPAWPRANPVGVGVL